MPLGVLCGGRLSKRKDLLFLFREHIMRDPKEWAERAGISLRQIENISISAACMPPSFMIPFYYGMRYILATSLGIDRQFILAADRAFCQGCVEYLEKNQAYYRNTLFQ